MQGSTAMCGFGRYLRCANTHLQKLYCFKHGRLPPQQPCTTATLSASAPAAPSPQQVLLALGNGGTLLARQQAGGLLQGLPLQQDSTCLLCIHSRLFAHSHSPGMQPRSCLQAAGVALGLCPLLQRPGLELCCKAHLEAGAGLQQRWTEVVAVASARQTSTHVLLADAVCTRL